MESPMQSTVEVKNRRRILCVFPGYSPSFGTFDSIYGMCGVSAFMPPQGILVIAAYWPAFWEVRFIDENIRRARSQDFAWADAVLVSGMHVQRPQILDICARAKATGKLAVLGGPSVSGAPDTYPQFDVLHIGELGDATDALIRRLDETCAPAGGQVRLETSERLPLADFPIPAYPLNAMKRYFIARLPFSSGCPYRCEFCDIPALYGRNPRFKTPEQVVAELDALMVQGPPQAVYFVDDNFIGNRKAAKALLPHLIAWQKHHHYPLKFACEATLNIAGEPELLAMMREAFFYAIFVGIETPDPDALRRMSKDQNAKLPILDAVRTINSFGMEVVSGIIIGLDTDTPDTADRLLAFIAASQIPMLTINLLQALPRTPLWDRLHRAGRLIDDPDRESNIAFARPYEEVLGMWRRWIAEAYRPEAVYGRFAYNARHTYPNRITPDAAGRLTWINLRRGLTLLVQLVLRVGLLADYRRWFWRVARPEFASRRFDEALCIPLGAPHPVTF